MRIVSTVTRAVFENVVGDAEYDGSALAVSLKEIPPGKAVAVMQAIEDAVVVVLGEQPEVARREAQPVDEPGAPAKQSKSTRPVRLVASPNPAKESPAREPEPATPPIPTTQPRSFEPAAATFQDLEPKSEESEAGDDGTDDTASQDDDADAAIERKVREMHAEAVKNDQKFTMVRVAGFFLRVDQKARDEASAQKYDRAFQLFERVADLFGTYKDQPEAARKSRIVNMIVSQFNNELYKRG